MLPYTTVNFTKAYQRRGGGGRRSSPVDWEEFVEEVIGRSFPGDFLVEQFLLAISSLSFSDLQIWKRKEKVKRVMEARKMLPTYTRQN